MTTIKIVILKCAVCGRPSLDHGTTIADLISPAHQVPETVVEARTRAHREGWVHDRLNRDVCGDCRTFPQRRTHKNPGHGHV